MPAPFLGAEEAYGVQPQAAGNFTGVIGQNTDRAVGQINMAAEENARAIAQKGAALRSLNPVGEYQQGETHAQQMAQGAQALQEGQQRMAGRELSMEQTRGEMADTARHRAWLTGIDPATGKSHEQEANEAQLQTEMQAPGFAKESHTLEMNRGNQEIATLKSQQQYANAQYENLRHEQAMSRAVDEYKAAVASNDQNAMKEINHRYSSVLNPQELSRAQQMGQQALAEGVAGRDLVAESTPQGIEANRQLDQHDQKVQTLNAVAKAVNDYNNSGWMSNDREAAKQTILSGLQSLGPEGASMAQYIQTPGLSMESSRVDEAFKRVSASVENEGQQIQAEHGQYMMPNGQAHMGLPSTRFQNRLNSARSGMQFVNQTANDQGNIQVVQGAPGSSPQNAKMQNASFINDGPAAHGPRQDMRSKAQLLNNDWGTPPPIDKTPISQQNSAAANPNALPTAAQWRQRQAAQKSAGPAPNQLQQPQQPPMQSAQNPQQSQVPQYVTASWAQ